MHSNICCVFIQGVVSPNTDIATSRFKEKFMRMREAKVALRQYEG